jgi:GNAT superfamily N-acetyltransferase
MPGTTDEEWADRLAHSLGEAFEMWLGQSGRGGGRDGDVRWLAGPAGIPFFNGVHCAGREVDLDVLTWAEETVSRYEVAHRIDVREGADSAIASWAAARGYARAAQQPALVLHGDAFEVACRRTDARVRAATRADVPRWHEVSMGVFGLPVEPTRALAPASIADDPLQPVWLAEIDGELVGTAQGYVTGDAVGVFNVAVLAEHRGQGLGAALTAAVVGDGSRTGASWAYLQSSPDGLPVYERLGFRTVEHWATFLPASLVDAH